MELPEVIDRVRPSVVQVTSAYFAERKSLGTGFLVSEEAHVITAHHVLEEARDLQAEFPSADIRVGIGIAHPNSENIRAKLMVTDFEVLGEDSRHDLALLRMKQNPFQGEVRSGIVTSDSLLCRVATLNRDRPRDGDGIAVSGYPLGAMVLLTNTGIVASSWATTIDVDVLDPTKDTTYQRTRSAEPTETWDRYLADVQTNPGNSGGPVYSTHDGAVIGVHVASMFADVVAKGKPASVAGVPLTADAGMSVVVPARYVCEMLDRHGVSWTSS
jgi:S1-C subfamily serine protease